MTGYHLRLAIAFSGNRSGIDGCTHSSVNLPGYLPVALTRLPQSIHISHWPAMEGFGTCWDCGFVSRIVCFHTLPLQDSFVDANNTPIFPSSTACSAAASHTYMQSTPINIH